jgi:hypothetical protein
MEKIDWQKCKWLQPKTLKTLMEVDFKKLVKSFQENDNIDPLKVWQEKPGVMWILDGHHRQKILEHCLQNEPKKPPRLMSAIFVDCKDKKEAAKFCLLYASEYAKIQDEGLYEFLHTFDLDFSGVKGEIELPEIDLDDFEENFYTEPNYDLDKTGYEEDLRTYNHDEQNVINYNTMAIFNTKSKFTIPEIREDMLSERIPSGLYFHKVDKKKAKKDAIFIEEGRAYPENTKDIILAFYAEDFKFEYIWRDVDIYVQKIKNAGITDIVTPNYSAYDNSPVAWSIWQFFKIRWLSRFWQEAGIKIILDIFESHLGEFQDILFEGIPKRIPVAMMQMQTNSRDNKILELYLQRLKNYCSKIDIENLVIYASKNKQAKIENPIRTFFDKNLVFIDTYQDRLKEIKK